MKTATKITSDAISRAKSACHAGMHEYELEAELMHVFYSRGARKTAFNPTIASGKNACILHYEANKSIMQHGQLVLIDAGAEYEHYASDLSRTFPVDGLFKPMQQEIYNIVKHAHEKTIAQITPGLPYNKLQETAAKEITDGLKHLGFLSGDLNELIEKEKYRKFMPHNVSHWVGLDAHDVGGYKKNETWRKLEPFMVLTVEPGIYIQDDEHEENSIGVRIEDEILVTESG
ncbi:unnamed protein product, partial [marine sediment metagenome]